MDLRYLILDKGEQLHSGLQDEENLSSFEKNSGKQKDGEIEMKDE